MGPWMAAIIPTVMAMMNKGGSEGEKSSTYTDQQQNLLNNSINNGPQDIRQDPGHAQGMDWLMSMFNDPEFFKNFEAPMMRQFNEETVPGLANRFASMGSGGSTGSTAFRNQLGREGGNLQTNIAALRGGMQQQGVNQLFQGAQMPISNYNDWLKTMLSPQPNNVYQPPSNPWAPISGAAWQGLMQNPNMFPGQSPSTTTAPPQ